MHVHVCHDVCMISIMFLYCSYNNNYYSKYIIIVRDQVQGLYAF